MQNARVKKPRAPAPVHVPPTIPAGGRVTTDSVPGPINRLDGFVVPDAKGVFYSRTALLRFVEAAELDAFLVDTAPTSHQRVAVDYRDGTWVKGGPEVAYGDRMIRTRFPTLPYAHPCDGCGVVKALPDMCVASNKEPSCPQMRRECLSCRSLAAEGSEARAREKLALTCTHRTCDTCCERKALMSFSGARATCSSCRDAQRRNLGAERAVATGAVQCTGCGVPKPKAVMGDLKSCPTCRAKGARNDGRPERRTYHNALNREKKYYARWRSAKRAEDEGAYLARNAAVMLAWRKANDWHDMQVSAARLDRVCDLSDAECTTIKASDCTWCGRSARFDSLNRIDRVDLGGDYTTANSVPACAMCKWMRGPLDVLTFLRRASHIAQRAVGGPHALYEDAWDERIPSTFAEHQTAALLKERGWSLTPEEFASVQALPCAACHRPGPSGVDRIDNKPMYQRDSVQPMCTECNCAKKDLPDHVFYAHIVKIANHGMLGCIDDVPVKRQSFSLR
jgi:hypothetical protein